jgi:hypothetical protein
VRGLLRFLTALRRCKFVEALFREGQVDQTRYVPYAATKPVVTSTHGRDSEEDMLEAMLEMDEIRRAEQRLSNDQSYLMLVVERVEIVSKIVKR